MKKILLVASYIFLSSLFLTYVTPSYAASWTGEGNLSWIQYAHKSTLLPSGKVIIAGGTYNTGTTNHTQIYTHGTGGTGTWASRANMNYDRNGLTLDLVTVDASTGATKVLVAGGAADGCSCVRNSAELYSESLNSWTTTPNMNQARAGHASSLLSDGKVLVTGGTSNVSGTTKLSSVEVYDPIANTWTTKTSLGTARASHQQITFTDSNGNVKVMVIGGNGQSTNAIKSTEIYDPVNNSWSAGPDLTYGRNNFTAVLLHDGRILAVGGDSPNYTKSEVYDPATNSWTTYITSYQTFAPKAVVLGSGASYKVLVSGGTSPFTSNSMLFDPSSNTWSTTTSMNVARGNFTMTLLGGGEVLAAGGNNSGGSLSSSEVYTP